MRRFDRTGFLLVTVVSCRNGLIDRGFGSRLMCAQPIVYQMGSVKILSTARDIFRVSEPLKSMRYCVLSPGNHTLDGSSPVYWQHLANTTELSVRAVMRPCVKLL